MSNIDTNLPHTQNKAAFIASKHFQPIYAEIIFGAPGKHCNGVGICRIIPSEHVRVHWKCPSARAWFSLNPNGTIRLAFDQNTLTEAIVRTYFDGQIFEVEEAYSIPSTLIPGLNKAAIVVEPGRYPVKVSGVFFIVDF